MLLLVNTSDERPEPPGGGGDGDGWDVLGAVLAWLFPWPAVIAWLFAGTIVLHDAAGMAFGVVTIAVCAWRGARAYPRWGGLSDYKQ